MDTPFFNTTIKCPICGLEYRFETIRVGAYVESGRDTDFCPHGVNWRFEELQGHNPLVYFTATCPKCYYSREFTDTFKNWESDATFKTYRLKMIRVKHETENKTPNSIIERLGGSIDIKNAPNESAIAKLLLAIRDEKFNEHPSNMALGRLYLRIAWVMRDLFGEAKTSAVSSSSTSALKEHYRGWSEGLSVLAKDTEEFFALIEKTAEKSTGSATGSDGLAIGVNLSKLAGAKEEILAHEGKLRILVSELAGLIDGSASNLSAANTKDTSAEFGGEANFHAFLLSIKSEWFEVPLNESEAIGLSIEYYKMALESGKEVSAGNQQIQVCYLIAELSRRVGEFQRAKEFFNSVIKVGQQFVYKFKSDKSRTAMARKILDLAMEQSQLNREQAATTVTQT